LHLKKITKALVNTEIGDLHAKLLDSINDPNGKIQVKDMLFQTDRSVDEYQEAHLEMCQLLKEEPPVKVEEERPRFGNKAIMTTSTPQKQRGHLKRKAIEMANRTGLEISAGWEKKKRPKISERTAEIVIDYLKTTTEPNIEQGLQGLTSKIANIERSIEQGLQGMTSKIANIERSIEQGLAQVWETIGYTPADLRPFLQAGRLASGTKERPLTDAGKDWDYHGQVVTFLENYYPQLFEPESAAFIYRGQLPFFAHIAKRRDYVRTYQFFNRVYYSFSGGIATSIAYVRAFFLLER